jgi:hypothetical protein
MKWVFSVLLQLFMRTSVWNKLLLFKAMEVCLCPCFSFLLVTLLFILGIRGGNYASSAS